MQFRIRSQHLIMFEYQSLGFLPRAHPQTEKPVRKSEITAARK